MKAVISFFMSVCFAVMSLMGIPFDAPDLEKTEMSSDVATKENIELFRKIYETETEWLSSLQLENGAIPMTYSKNGQLTVNPYFADFAALRKQIIIFL